jgi:arylsulfatase A-like enzyme
MPGLEHTSPEDYITETLTDRTISFIEIAAASKQPFFVYLPHYAVHLPLSARKELIAKYRNRFGDKAYPNAIYAAMLESFDAELGKLRRSLDRLGIAENTVIFLTSDNGGLRYEGSSKQLITENTPFRAGKGHLYEGGIRDPLIVQWPRMTKPGSVSDALVCSIDLVPTICDIAGAAQGSNIDGVSLRQTLRNNRPTARDTLFWHYPHYSNQGGVPSGAVRKGDWKLIEFYEDGRLELFDLRTDPGERRNLIKAEPRRAGELHALLRKWRESVNASMPLPNPNYDPGKAQQGLTGAEPPTAPVLP